MKSKIILFLCVALVIALSVMLTTAIPPTDKPEMPEQAPFQTCVEGDTTCVGNNSYYCEYNNQWLLQEANSESCGYNAPRECDEGETGCFGFNEYTCLNNEWVLTALNNESCGYVCTSGASYCDGVDLNICMNNAWTVVEDSPSCGYVAPADVQKHVSTLHWEDNFDVSAGPVGGSTTRWSNEDVDLGSPMTVTLYSGGVSGGAYCWGGAHPMTAAVYLCEEMDEPFAPVYAECNDYIITLPLYSEVTFENIRYIRLLDQLSYTHPEESGKMQINIFSSVVYSTS